MPPEPVLQAELIKTGQFEAVAADSQTLRNCTGRLGWTGEEDLPLNFFDSLKQYYGCDAVLFCHLTVFRSSPPPAIGWRLKLADVKTGQTLWAANDVFDANDPGVAKAAQQFAARGGHHPPFECLMSFELDDFSGSKAVSQPPHSTTQACSLRFLDSIRDLRIVEPAAGIMLDYRTA
ncbi:MAG TPA: hypothetical protein VGY56_12350 [Verrucomicrobiae bacterium]|nr:hypothetical protein [Verrucomicrobiae bacterium]